MHRCGGRPAGAGRGRCLLPPPRPLDSLGGGGAAGTHADAACVGRGRNSYRRATPAGRHRHPPRLAQPRPPPPPTATGPAAGPAAVGGGGGRQEGAAQKRTLPLRRICAATAPDPRSSTARSASPRPRPSPHHPPCARDLTPPPHQRPCPPASLVPLLPLRPWRAPS